MDLCPPLRTRSSRSIHVFITLNTGILRHGSAESALLVERARQHREMRLRSNAELRERVSKLKARLEDERERLQKDYDQKVKDACPPNYSMLTIAKYQGGLKRVTFQERCLFRDHGMTRLHDRAWILRGCHVSFKAG